MGFREPLQSLQVEEGAPACLHCELWGPGSAVAWSKAGLELQADGRWELRRQGPVAELVLREARREDAGEYTCTCDGQATSATLTVTGEPPTALGVAASPESPWEGTQFLWATLI